MNPRPHHSDESGIALFYALLVVLVVGGIIVVTFSAALIETRQSAFELDFEDTIHVAESGAEAVLQQIDSDRDFTNASDPTVFAGSEYDWALAEAIAAPAGDLVDLGEGEAVGLRPSSGATEFVYGVGFTPSRQAFVDGAGEPYARVVKMEVGFTSAFAPGLYAFLSERLVDFNGGGNSSVYGSNGNVHTNADIDPPSSAGFVVDGVVSYIGDCGGCTDGANVTYRRTDTLVPINVGTPDQVYTSDAAETYLNGGGDWYDYCSGSWEVRGGFAQSTPCTGSGLAGNPSGWNGTTHNSSSANGVFYFDGDVNVSIGEHDVTMTVITGGDINMPNGNASLSWTPSYPALYAYAGDTVNWGNANVNSGGVNCNGGLDFAERASTAGIPPGVVYAVNEIVLGGNPTAVQVAFISDDLITFNGGGARCVVLETDGSADLGGEGQPVLVAWDELRP